METLELNDLSLDDLMDGIVIEGIEEINIISKCHSDCECDGGETRCHEGEGTNCAQKCSG